MKKIIIAFAALAAAFSLVSCSKEQAEATSTDLKLNITVSNIDGGTDTKAIKTGWKAGDKLNIWFDETDHTNPDLVIKYDGTEWKKDATAAVTGKKPAANGTLVVLYEGNNDWNSYTHTSDYMYPKTEAYAGAKSGYVFAQPIAIKNGEGITYTYSSNTLTANLNKWECITRLQVVVTGLDSSKAANYALKEQNMYRGTVYFDPGKTKITSSSESTNPTLGVPNEDGVAFCFTRSYYNPSNRNFTLIDLSTMQEKTYSISGVSAETSTTKIVGIKIAASKFE